MKLEREGECWSFSKSTHFDSCGRIITNPKMIWGTPDICAKFPCLQEVRLGQGKYWYGSKIKEGINLGDKRSTFEFFVEITFAWPLHHGHVQVTTFYRTQVSLGSDLWVLISQTEGLCWDLTDVTLADEDSNSIPTSDVNRAFQSNMAMQVAPCDGQHWI